MTGVSMNLWYTAVAVLAVATVILGESVLAAHVINSPFCERFVEPYGYICAEYRTHSADGFELVMHRIGRRPRLLRKPSPVSGTTGTYTPSSDCGIPDQPFNSPECVPSQAPSHTDNMTTEGSSTNGPDSSNDTSVEQNALYQENQTPIRGAVPYDGDEDKAQDQKPVDGRDPSWIQEDVSAHEESQHSESPYHSGLEALPDRHHRPSIRSLPKNSFSDTRPEVKVLKCFSHSKEKAHRPSHKHQGHHKRRNAVMTGSVTEGPSPPSPEPVDSVPGPSSSDAYGTPVAPDQSASAPSPTLGPSVAPEEAASRPSASYDHNPQEFKRGRAPVLLMHVELLNGDSWFQFTDDSDRLLPFLLVNAGFDVWIGHERATYWSHGHHHLKHNQQRYWNWTWDDHAKYDVPALLENIQVETGFSVHYIGISQSATVGAAAATMPESYRFMTSMTLIGPTIYRGNTSSFVLNVWAFLTGSRIDQDNWNSGYQHGAFNLTRAFPVVSSISGQGPFAAAMETISGPNCCLGSTAVSFTNGWDGTTSFKNLLHYQQGVRTNSWSHFDYGSPDENSQAYSVPYAPSYYPEDIPLHIPVLVIYGGQDSYAPASGIWDLLSRFSTRVTSVFLPTYAHFDLLYSRNRARDVYIPILQFLERHRWI